METKREYAMVTADKVDVFQERCSHLLNSGFEFFGAAIINDGDDWTRFYQAFVKYPEDDKGLGD